MTTPLQAPGAHIMPKAQAQSASAPDGRRDTKLWRACCQFEAIFVQQVLETMRASIPTSGLLPQGFSEDMHASMFDQAVGEAIGRKGHLGIASSMYRQMSPAQANGGNGDTFRASPANLGAAATSSQKVPGQGEEA